LEMSARLPPGTENAEYLGILAGEKFCGNCRRGCGAEFGEVGRGD